MNDIFLLCLYIIGMIFVWRMEAKIEISPTADSKEASDDMVTLKSASLFFEIAKLLVFGYFMYLAIDISLKILKDAFA